MMTDTTRRATRTGLIAMVTGLTSIIGTIMVLGFKTGVQTETIHQNKALSQKNEISIERVDNEKLSKDIYYKDWEKIEKVIDKIDRTIDKIEEKINNLD